MKQGIARIALLGIVVAPLPGHAAGFGEIQLHSRIGEPLRAEVGVSGGSEIDTACFSLANVPGSDLPVVTGARIKLVHEGGQRRLIITGTQPIDDPLFMIALRGQCGVDLKRDFALMPSAPAARTPPPPAIVRPTIVAQPIHDWIASDGDTLESIADVLAAGDPLQQRLQLQGLRRANPGIAPGAAIAGGTSVALPGNERKRPIEAPKPAAKPAKKPVAKPEAKPAAKPAAKPEPQPPADKPAVVPAPPKPAATNDRLVLGTADEAPPSPKAKENNPGSIKEMEERIQKLEATLQSLNQEIEQTNKVLELATEALSVQQKLRAAQGQITALAPDPKPAAPAESRASLAQQWAELVVSALIGGLVVAAAVVLLNRRRPAGAPMLHVPPAVHPTSSTSPATQEIPAPAAIVAGAATGPDSRRPTSGAGEVSVSYDDRDSALELAEIMLSFGRLQGAADTLNDYIEQHAPAQPQAWLMLLDLYRRGNMEAEYTRLAARIRECFNASVPDWHEAPALTSGLKSLESYTHILEHLSRTWGTPDCLDYLRQLVSDNRDGARAGFPLEVVEEIALLIHLLEDAYGVQQPA